MRNFVTFICGMAVGALAVALLSKHDVAPAPEVRVLTRRDTVRIETPRPVYRRVVDTVVVSLPLVADTGAVADVVVPLEQAVYGGVDYKVYVSGYRPRLDSLQFVASECIHTTIMPAVIRSKRFSVGIQAGYGITPRGFQPFLGVGVSLKIVEF